MPWCFTPLERRRLLSAVQTEIADGSVMLPSAGCEAPVLTGFTATRMRVRPIPTISSYRGNDHQTPTPRR